MIKAWARNAKRAGTNRNENARGRRDIQSRGQSGDCWNGTRAGAWGEHEADTRTLRGWTIAKKERMKLVESRKWQNSWEVERGSSVARELGGRSPAWGYIRTAENELEEVLSESDEQPTNPAAPYLPSYPSSRFFNTSQHYYSPSTLLFNLQPFTKSLNFTPSFST